MSLRMSRLDVLAERLIEFVARGASGIPIDRHKLQAITGPTILPVVMASIEAVAQDARSVRRGLLFCGICGKGPYTKRGMYLHLVRVHRYELKMMILEELQDRVREVEL